MRKPGEMLEFFPLPLFPLGLGQFEGWSGVGVRRKLLL